MNHFFSVTAQVDHATITLYYTLPSGIRGIQSSSSCSVVPNPIVNQGSFHFSSSYSTAIFSLYNLNGILQTKEIFSGNSFEWNRNHLPSGFYFYTLESNGSIVVRGKINLE